MLLSRNHRNDESRPPPPDPRNTIRESELELPGKGRQEHVHLDNAARIIRTAKRQFFFPGNESVITNANLHPIQALTPPENVALQGDQPCSEGQVIVTHRFPYTPTGDSGFPVSSSHRSGRHS